MRKRDVSFTPLCYLLTYLLGSPGGFSLITLNTYLLTTYLLLRLLTGVRHHPPGRTDQNLCRCFGAPAVACRVFPDHLITTSTVPPLRVSVNLPLRWTGVRLHPSA